MDLDAFKVTLYTSKPSAFAKPLMLAYQNCIGSLAQGFWARGIREPFEMIFDEQSQVEARFKA